MSDHTAPRIAYPTFVEHLEQLRGSGMTFGEMARRIGTKEETVIGWTNETVPGTRYIKAIERELKYSFTARRFAEAVADAAFPPREAPVDIAAIRTHEDLVAYLRRVREIVTIPALAAFFGWEVSTLNYLFTDTEIIPSRERLAQMLQRLHQLPDHLSGAVLSRCTPRAVIGRLLRDARQARGEIPERYAKRVGIAESMLKIVEASGTGHQSPSKTTIREKATGHRSQFFKVPADHDRILTFLGAERVALGDRLATPATAASMSQEPAAPPAEAAVVPRAPAAPAQSGTSRRAVHDRLHALVERVTLKRASALLEIPKSTIQGVLAHVQLAKRTTVARIAAALDVYERGLVEPEPQAPVAQPAASLERRLAELEAQVGQLTAGAATSGSGAADGTAYVSPLSPFRFQPHHDQTSATALAEHRAAIRDVCERLGHLASHADDQTRWRIQRELGKDTDELYVTLEGFLRQYPSGALVTLEEQRRFHDEQRGVLNTQSTAAGSPPGPPKKKE